MKNKIKKIKLIGLDIPDGYLQYLDNLLYTNGLFKENGAVYIKGHDEVLDYDLDNVEYARFLMEFKDSLSIGRCTNPTKIFKTFKVVFDFFQYKNSPYRSYILRDPSLIDTTPILSLDLVENNLLESVLNTLDISINKDILEMYYIHGLEVLKKANRIPYWIIDTIELMGRISEEMYSLIAEHASGLDFEDGKHYNLRFYRNMVIAEELEDIRVVRYKNIIDKSRDTIRRSIANDATDTDELIDILLTMKNEDIKYKSILLNKLVYTTEKLEEVEYRLIDRAVISPLNIDVPLEDEDYQEWIRN